MQEDAKTATRPIRLALGPLAAGVVFGLLQLTDLPVNAALVAALGVWMGLWWMTDAVALEVTGMLPLVVLPTLGVVSAKAAAAPYASEVIFLLIGGTLLAAALEKWNLHTRLALAIIGMVGTSPKALVGGFLCVTSFISMWVSNTAACAMLLPVALSVTTLMDSHAGDSVLSPGNSPGGSKARAGEPRALTAALLLAVTYGASIGGVGTLIGTPPTAQLAAHFRENMKIPITFLEWMFIGVPMILVFIPAAWLVLTRIAFRLDAAPVQGASQILATARAQLGPMGSAEFRTLLIFLTTVGFWLTSAWSGIPDAVIAIGGVILLFITPSKGVHSEPVLTWPTASRVPWGIWFLFGGGLSLASAMESSGLAAAIASLGSGLEGVPALVVLVVISLFAVILTEFSSNSALVAMGIPIVSAIAPAVGLPPSLLIVTLTLSASLGFMLPAGTAANALVYQTGKVSTQQMMRAGLILNILSGILVPAVVYGVWKMGLLPGA